MGPGRMIANSTTRSSSVSGRERGSVCICARDSIWKTPTVSAAPIMAKTSGRSSGRRSRSTWTPQSAWMSRRASSMADSMRSPSRSSLMSFIDSMSRLSYWTTTRPGIEARSSGAMSTSGARVTSMPPTWMPRWGGKPSMRAHSSSQRSQGERPTVLPPRGCGGDGGSGGSQWLGGLRGWVRRSGGRSTPVSGSMARPPIVPGGASAAWPGPATRPGPATSLSASMSLLLSPHSISAPTAPPIDSSRSPGCSPAADPRSPTPCPGSIEPPPRSRSGRARPTCVPRDSTTDIPAGSDGEPGSDIPTDSGATGPPPRRHRTPPGPAPLPPPPPARGGAARGGGAAGPARVGGGPGAQRHPRRRGVGQGARQDRGHRRRRRGAEELGEAAVRLQVPPHHARVVRFERLGHAVHERAREAQRVPHLAHGRPRPVGDDVADHARVGLAIALVDVLDHLLAARRGEVDVHVRVGRPPLVDEALEEEAVADGVDAGDAEHVGEDRVARAAAPLGRDAPLAGEAHEVPADEEELGQAGALDDVELVGELLDDGGRHGLIALPRSLVAEPLEDAEGRLPPGHGEAG